MSVATVPQAPAGAHAKPVFFYGRFVNLFVGFLVFCGSIAIVEPSPYDFASILAIPLWFLGGFSVHKRVIVFIALILVYNLGGFISLAPYWNEPDPTLFMLQSLYLMITAIFFVLFFSQDAAERGEICLKAFGLSCVFAAMTGIVGYFDFADTGRYFATYGRAAGTFKDPNVLGSYLIMGALYYMQTLMLGRTKHFFITAILLVVVITGIFLSFSRGSWGAFIMAAITMVALAFGTTANQRLRRRISVMTLLAIVAVVLVLGVALSMESTRQLFLQRAEVTQDYDIGETGRFGNQMRSIPMLFDLPNGMGPLRFRLTFFLEPHNSYINSFASYGWLGGFAFFTLVGTTIFTGFRLCILRSPVQRIAQVYWPTLFVFLLQGFQIDIDHWRHVWLMFGAVWGLEAARVRWRSATDAGASIVASQAARRRAPFSAPA